MRALLYLLLRRVLGLFRSDERAAAEAELENAILRHQVAVLRKQVKRPIYQTSDKAFLAPASRILHREAWDAFLVRPATLLRFSPSAGRIGGNLRLPAPHPPIERAQKRVRVNPGPLDGH
jgi:hypothetical protein